MVHVNNFIEFCNSNLILNLVLESVETLRLPDELIYTDAIESYKGERLYPVYIVLVRSNTPVAKVITTFTKSTYSHCSISFDYTMKKMYSFGAKFDDDGNYIPSEGIMPNSGFTKENIKNSILLGHNSPYSIYVTFVNKSELKLMKNRLKWFIKNETKFKFNSIGLIKNFFNIESHSPYKLFCSQFVSDILNTGKPGFTQKENSLMKPQDFTETLNCYHVCDGIVDKFNASEVKENTEKILNRINKRN